MKKILLASLAALSAGSFGCALTDYPRMGVQNKSHGLIGCTTDDRIANSQQTFEPGTRDLLYTSSFGMACPGFNPGVTLNQVSHEDARDWNRFLAVYNFFGEAQVTGFGQGTYILSGVKDLADGSTRINNFFTPQLGFSCVGASVDGRYGGPEGVIAGDALGRLPGLRLDSVALDSSATSVGFCSNLVAVSADAAANGFSTYWNSGARGGEGRIAATPVVRREGLASFLQGGTQTITLQGVSITGRGNLLPDGSIQATLLSLSSGQATYTAESPLTFTVQPENNFRAVKVENSNMAELLKLAQFAIDGGLTDREIQLGGTQILDAGYTFPDVSFLLSGETLRRFIETQAAPRDTFGN